MNQNFLNLAKKTKSVWNNKTKNNGPWTTSGWHREQAVYNDNCVLRQAETNCGVYELTNLKGKSQSFIVRDICYEVARQDHGTFLFYCPQCSPWKEQGEKLEKLGFTVAFEFQHLCYLNRKPDHGVTKVYQLTLTPQEKEELLAL